MEEEAGFADIIQCRVGSPHQNKLLRKEVQTVAAAPLLVSSTMKQQREGRLLITQV